MKRMLRALLLVAFPLLLISCGSLTTMLESHEAAVARSLEDSTVVFSRDTAFYLGKPLCAVAPQVPLSATPTTLSTFGGRQLLTVTDVYVGSDTTEYRVVLSPGPDTIMVRSEQERGEGGVLARLIRARVLTADSVDHATAKRLLAAGQFRTVKAATDAYNTRVAAYGGGGYSSGSTAATSSASTRRSPSSSSSSSSGASASSSRPSSSSSSSSASGPVRVNNGCSNTVVLVAGEVPGNSSGEFVTIGGSSYTHMSSVRGKKLWIVDANRRGVTSIRVGNDVSEINVARDGRSLSAR